MVKKPSAITYCQATLHYLLVYCLPLTMTIITLVYIQNIKLNPQCTRIDSNKRNIIEIYQWVNVALSIFGLLVMFKMMSK